MDQLLKALTEFIRTLTDISVMALDFLEEQKEHERIEHEERMYHLGQQVSEAPRVRRRPHR